MGFRPRNTSCVIINYEVTRRREGPIWSLNI